MEKPRFRRFATHHWWNMEGTLDPVMAPTGDAMTQILFPGRFESSGQETLLSGENIVEPTVGTFSVGKNLQGGAPVR